VTAETSLAFGQQLAAFIIDLLDPFNALDLEVVHVFQLFSYDVKLDLTGAAVKMPPVTGLTILFTALQRLGAGRIGAHHAHRVPRATAHHNSHLLPLDLKSVRHQSAPHGCWRLSLGLIHGDFDGRLQTFELVKISFWLYIL
jgi:hypothetical protein